MAIEQEDIVLIQSILVGNKFAEEKFYKKYKKIITDYLRSKYPKHTDIEDCVSEILIKVFYSFDKYDAQKSGVKSWVLTIAKHYMIDLWRSNTSITATLNACNVTYTTSCDNTFGISNSSGTMTTTGVNTLAFVNNTGNFTTSCHFENCNAVTYISSQISAADFTLLDMKYVQGYNYNEIGSEFQLTSSTVSNKINYIKTKLKKSIPEDIFE